MTFKIRLDNHSLFGLTRWFNTITHRYQRKLIDRLTDGRDFAVWDLPYGDPEAIKSFVANLRMSFPSNVLEEMILFVNHGIGGSYASYLAAGFPTAIMPFVRPTLNSIPNVLQNFNVHPAMLIAMSVQGVFTMETNITPDRVDAAFVAPQPNTRS
jgi:hypothetical protein